MLKIWKYSYSGNIFHKYLALLINENPIHEKWSALQDFYSGR